MTLRHLRIFICVCEQRTMTKAATTLNMAQPSVSQAIHELEEHYGSLLFERLGHRLILTQAGQCLLAYAYDLIRLYTQTESAMKSLRQQCPLRVGASITIGEFFLVDLLQYMAQQYPTQEICSEIHNTAELEAMLLNDDLDLALVEGKIQSPSILTMPFMDDELVFIAAPGHALVQKKTVRTADLAKEKFFIREAGSGTRNLFEAVMNEARVTYETAGIYNNAESLKKAVEAGLGISVISRRTITNELAENKLATFTVPGLSFKRTFRIAYHKDKYLSPPIRELMEACRHV
jgi:DNA-binding transcriptional LysR family regulator